MKKCAIVNYWWADGHGAVLTAVALAHLVENNGFVPVLIKTTTSISSHESEKGRNFKFAEKYVQCTHRNYQTIGDFKDLNEEFDTFILGSDQVFRLEWVPDTWFFNGIDYKKNMIAVAASFGIDKINNSKSRIKCVSQYLNRFNAISVRELDALDVYKKYFGYKKDVKVVIDPVFLVKKEFYGFLSADGEIEEANTDYIFFYILDKNDAAIALAKELEEKYECKVVWETFETSPENFLLYIEHAKMVVTDSFHGSCFSIIYNKPFYCIYNEKRGVSRINSLKEIFDIEEGVFIDYKHIRDESFDVPYIDYTEVNQILDAWRDDGIKWIRKALLHPFKKPYLPKWMDALHVFALKTCNRMVGKILKLKRRLKNND